MITAIFALTILMSHFEPVTGLLMYRGLGGMHGETFGEHSPAIFLSLTVAVKYIVSLALAFLCFRILKMKNRVSTPVGGFYFLWIGGLLITVPVFIRILTASVEGGGMTFAVFSIIGPFVGIAKIVFYIGIFLFLLSVKPSDKYTYPN